MPSLSGVFCDGSPESGRLTCGSIAPCERSASACTFPSRCTAAKTRIRPLTCMRALPGIWLTTGPLARTSTNAA